MHLRVKLTAVVAAVGVAGVGTAAIAHDRSHFDAGLSGYEETPQAISTNANGSFRAQINRGGTEIRYTLVYNGTFNGTPAGTVTQAHIHFGRPAIGGGISVFLCGTGALQPPAPTPEAPQCPAAGTPVSGVLTAANVIGPATQAIAAGEFDELVRAMRAGATYANVHTTAHGGGEIRGQISDDGDNRHRGDH